MNIATSSAQREIRVHMHVGSEAKKQQGIFTIAERGASQTGTLKELKSVACSTRNIVCKAPGVFREWAPSAHAQVHSGITALPPTKLHSLNLRRKDNSLIRVSNVDSTKSRESGAPLFPCDDCHGLLCTQVSSCRWTSLFPQVFPFNGLARSCSSLFGGVGVPVCFYVRLQFVLILNPVPTSSLQRQRAQQHVIRERDSGQIAQRIWHSLAAGLWR